MPPRVLVVDDDHMIRDILAEALGDEGYDIATATNGREALAVVQRWHPQLILLDLMMPEMDGWAFRAHQRTLGDAANIPVIVLSARRDLAEQAQTMDAADVIPKPFDLGHLLTSVDRFLGRVA